MQCNVFSENRPGHNKLKRMIRNNNSDNKQQQAEKLIRTQQATLLPQNVYITIGVRSATKFDKFTYAHLLI